MQSLRHQPPPRTLGSQGGGTARGKRISGGRGIPGGEAIPGGGGIPWDGEDQAEKCQVEVVEIGAGVDRSLMPAAGLITC